MTHIQWNGIELPEYHRKWEFDRLRNINAKLLEALKAFVDMNPTNEKEMFIAVTNAKLAIAKVEGEKNAR